MANQTAQTYLNLMSVIRSRFDVIEATKASKIDEFLKAETCAFHARKIIEAIAFGCIVALDNSLKHIPRDVKGQWKADAILDALDKKNLGSAFPSPSEIRVATAQEKQEHNAQQILDGKPDRRITKEELKKVYERMHRWNHEINPYVSSDREVFLKKNQNELWVDIDKLNLFVSRHFISIGGKGFFSVLVDRFDGLTKVCPIGKEGSVVV